MALARRECFLSFFLSFVTLSSSALEQTRFYSLFRLVHSFYVLGSLFVFVNLAYIPYVHRLLSWRQAQAWSSTYTISLSFYLPVVTGTFS